jgi:hypothetical protein
MKKFLAILKKIWTWKYWKIWHEFIPVIVFCPLWFFILSPLQKADPGYGGMSMSLAEKAIFITLYIMWANFCSWILIRLVFPSVWSYKQKIFDIVFDPEIVTPKSTWESAKMLLFVYCFFMFLFVAGLSLIL